MIHLWSSATLFSLLSGSLALSPNFLACQTKKPPGSSPLLGCPSGTTFVSHNTSDVNANFHSIQEAVLSLNNTKPATILIAEGEYHETVTVTRNGPLILLGQLLNASSNSLNYPFANASEVPLKQNLVKVWNNKFVQNGTSNAQTAVLLITPSPHASFGTVDFKAYNIDFENRAANFAISQALVTYISYANASFYGCSFASYQDTWYTGRNANTYVVDSIIYGQTDYIFGYGTAWFQNTVLANRACGGGLVAWKGTNLTDAPGNRFGAYIADSSIIRSPDANATTVTKGKCYLGRPWNDLATTVYLRTYMDDSIRPAGWKPWGSARPVILNTTFYAEFDSSGPGGNTSARTPVEHILTPDEAQNFTIDKVFLEHPKWIDFEYSF
ncbi:carbohydrate esterase family 8 protein [Phlegmacium glaucopus]|nr:carbohydrate esterase family 8 protein [Phlegmacium glaucopus]